MNTPQAQPALAASAGSAHQVLICPECRRPATEDHNSFWCDPCRRLWPKGAGHELYCSATPSRQSVQLVRDWLWLSPMRETVGSPWTGDYIRDAARMVDATLATSPRLRN